MFDIAKQQDLVMHNLSSELSVKTSLYLVFSAFVITASIQMMNFAKDTNPCSTRYAVLFCALGAGFALLAGLSLLIAAAVRNYSIFPLTSMADWLRQMEEFRKNHPDNHAVDSSRGFMGTLIKTIDNNQIVNEKRARWIERGMWFLLISLPFTATGGICAVWIYFSRLS